MLKKYAEMLNMQATLASDLFNKVEHPWEALPLLKTYIVNLIPKLGDDYIMYAENVYVHKSVTISHSAYIKGPCIIGKNTDVRHCAFIRGSALIGDNCVIGNSTEIKNAIIFNGAKCPHYNYIGDAIIGENAHTGAGVILSNMKNDKTNIVVKDDNEYNTFLRKFSAVLGNNVEVGCNSVICPGTLIYENTSIYPLSMVRGTIKADIIYKSKTNIVKKEVR